MKKIITGISPALTQLLQLARKWPHDDDDGSGFGVAHSSLVRSLSFSLLY